MQKKVDKYWADRKEDGNAKRNAELEEKGVKRKAPEAVAQDLERSAVSVCTVRSVSLNLPLRACQVQGEARRQRVRRLVGR